ncbi:MAG TPA: type IV toxin-antitoxin system AbiEi family antitoxin [Gemmatimonadaceae bacterium]
MSDSTTTARTIPRGLARLVEELELERPLVITTGELAAIARRLRIPVSSPSELARRLRKHGWILPLRGKSAWEFAPGSRAGRTRSGDAHSELRATLARRPDFPGQLAYESAAWIHGLLDRQPVHHVLSMPAGVPAPPSIKGDYRIVHWLPKAPPVHIDGLPVWSIESLLVAMTAHPTSYRDWPNVLDWLPHAVSKLSHENLERELKGQPQSVRTKLAYLLKRANADRQLLSLIDPPSARRRPLIYFGPRTRVAHAVKEYNLRDSLLEPEW